MAQRVVLSDDFDGSVAAETVSFSLDGRDYEVDLSDEHVTELREFLNHYIAVGRRKQGPAAGRRSGRPSKKSPRSSATDVSPRAIRQWATDNGITVSARGRIPAGVVEQFRQAVG